MTTTKYARARITRTALRAALGATAIGVVVALLGACAASPQPASTSSPAAAAITRSVAPEGELSADLQAALQKTLEDTMAEYRVPGAAVGVWVPGQGSWTRAAGLADIDGNVPATTEMQWPLRSVTKSYTVTLLLQLLDEGKLSLDDTIDQYVEGVTDGDQITLRQLANMSSGNADYTNDAFVADFVADPTRIFTLDELNAFMLGLPAQFAPGERRVYTNADTNLLGAAIEKVTGQPFADVIEERILQPLGQTGTRYLLDAATWKQAHPSGYVPEGDAMEEQPDNLSVFGPAGSMISTLDDARAWGESLAEGTFLTAQTQEARLEGEPLEAGPPYDIYALGMGETDGWWGHNGEGFGFTAAVFHDLDTGATIAVFMNESDEVSGAHPADQAFRRFAEVLAEEKNR